MRRALFLALSACALAAGSIALARPAAQGGAASPPMELRSIVSGGLQRWYRVHQPVGWDGTRPLPVVLAFHGGGGNARQFAEHSGMWKESDRSGFLLVFPEGTGRLGGAPRFLLETWNAGDCCGWAESHGVDDVRFVRDLVADLAGAYRVDLARVFATGHSNGGMMSYRLAVEAPDVVRAVALNAAALMAPGTPAAAIPVLALHGRRDANVPWQGGVGSGVSGADFSSQRDSLMPFMQVNGCAASTLAETRGAAHRWEAASPLGAPVHYWWLDDHGHAWPGHGSGMPGGEPCNYDIDANVEIWAFFARF